MRCLILLLFVISYQPLIQAKADDKCPKQLNEKQVTQKMSDLAEQFAKSGTFQSKKQIAQKLLTEINCELERTTSMPLDDSYRWVLSDYHAILSDVTTAKDCKNLEEKMTFSDSNQGTFSEEPLKTKQGALIKKLAKNLCQSQ